VTDRVVAALNRMTINPNRQRVRGEGSHAWTLKNKCRGRHRTISTAGAVGRKIWCSGADPGHLVLGLGARAMARS
jgi:hypothetical protein